MDIPAIFFAILTLCMLGNFACFFVAYGFILRLNFSKKISGIPSRCQTVWMEIRPDVLSGLIWIQTVCKGYQQMTKVATSGEGVNKRDNTDDFQFSLL